MFMQLDLIMGGWIVIKKGKKTWLKMIKLNKSKIKDC